MALTLTVTKTSVVGDSRMVLGTWSGDTSYPNGGYPVTPAMLGLVSMDQFSVTDDNLGFTAYYSTGGAKIVVVVRSTGAQAAASANVVGAVGTFMAIGR